MAPVALDGRFGQPAAVLRAVFLDLDDTLFDRRVALVAWAQQVAQAQRSRELDAAELATLIDLDDRGLRDRDAFARDVETVLGLRVDAAAFSAQLAEHVVPEPGVLATVGALAACVRVAVVTNGGGAQRAKLARVGLAGVVHEVFVSCELGVAKPAAAVFAQALKWAGCDPSRAMMVGDQPAIDLAPAARLGMTTVWRVRGAWPTALPPPDHRIECVSALAELPPLRALLATRRTA